MSNKTVNVQQCDRPEGVEEYRYLVVSTRNTLHPRLGTFLTENEVTSLIHKPNTTVNISQIKRGE